ncbi:MAG: hypothetical protein NPIRA02_09400 [Nitrospirales bacterium]|nr:MAG: hypothetical protein NPIRA02_09400 [Nitrospirales bacterium]
MRKLFVSQSLIEVESRKDMLDQEGILCTIKNQQGSSLAGEVPFAEVFPELWVINDGEYARAKAILDQWDDASPSETSIWICVGCSECHTGEFTTCWKCGRERPDS